MEGGEAVLSQSQGMGLGPAVDVLNYKELLQM